MSADTARSETADSEVLHRGVAEQGKLYALAGDHPMALVHYREAMRMAVEGGGPEAFFRHYLECSMESLELMGAHDDVIDYCLRVAEHYATITPTDELQERFIALDRAANQQRLGVNLLKAGRAEEAAPALQAAVAGAEAAGGALPLAALITDWSNRRLMVDAARLEAEQRRLHYFSVTTDSVDAEAAVHLPDELLRGTR